MPNLRLGIDVGGTFTDVVAIDAQQRSIVASLKVPTTHNAPEGVAAGIIAGINTLFETHGIAPSDIAFIAHSTTQATNALLEGDVADVGVVGLLDVLAPFARLQMRFKPFDLAPGVPFAATFAFAHSSDAPAIGRAFAQLKAGGVQSVAVSQAFGVDRPQIEQDAVDAARAQGFEATSGHDVSSMYGLRARTRTAALNAAILPKMIKTARMTQGAVEAAAIRVPLMIMRSDGGVMEVREMERRPLLTLLSGPAAGVAGALLHENVTDGIFIEVGGTSSDCSAIRAGSPQMRPARVGGHRTMLRTLDVRTLAIAGGSMPRVDDGRIIDAGPRSAHIAGCKYVSFIEPELLGGAKVEMLKPGAHDPADYAVLRCADGTLAALTPTCAANMLGFVPAGAFAAGNAVSARRGFEIMANYLGADSDTVARDFLTMACAKLCAAVDELIADYGLERETLVLVGGGGGAAALVPFAAQQSKLDFRLARDAEVISPVGVALALVRETVERTLVNPSPEDIVRIRREAQDAVIAAGASPQSTQVAIEIDAQRNIVRAVASGAAAAADSSLQRTLSAEDLAQTAAKLMRVAEPQVRALASTGPLTVFECTRGRSNDVRVLDASGVGRLSLRAASVRASTFAATVGDLRDVLEAETAFGDVGRALPELYVLHGARIADFSGLASADQAAALAQEELAGGEPDAPVVLLTVRRAA